MKRAGRGEWACSRVRNEVHEINQSDPRFWTEDEGRKTKDDIFRPPSFVQNQNRYVMAVLRLPGLAQHAQPVLVGKLAQRRVVEAMGAQSGDQLGHTGHIS